MLSPLTHIIVQNGKRWLCVDKQLTSLPPISDTSFSALKHELKSRISGTVHVQSANVDEYCWPSSNLICTHTLNTTNANLPWYNSCSLLACLMPNAKWLPIQEDFIVVPQQKSIKFARQKQMQCWCRRKHRSQWVSRASAAALQGCCGHPCYWLLTNWKNTNLIAWREMLGRLISDTTC